MVARRAEQEVAGGESCTGGERVERDERGVWVNINQHARNNNTQIGVWL